MEWLEFSYLGLFSGTFIASTLLPLPSEGILLGFYLADFPIVPVLVIATLGNFLGGLTNYYIGYAGRTDKLIKWFKLDTQKLVRWEKRFARFGIYLGLFSWVPFIGDPMVAALGFFRIRIIPLSIMMLIGKFLRYFVLTLIYLYW